jgi:hypothetical protein
MIDSSNHKHNKLVPILVRYFVPQQGVKMKILDFTDLSGESSAQLTEHIVHVLEEAKLIDKVVSLSADNSNENFGGAKRRRKNNVFERLKNKIQRDIIGVGCAAHIVYNTVQTAADCLPVDIESTVAKIYQYFHIYTVRAETLKDFCEFVDVEYKNILLGHTNTRWLSLIPAVKRIVVVYPALASYFLSIEKCPTMLKKFFLSKRSFLCLIFLENQLEMFNAYIKGT